MLKLLIFPISLAILFFSNALTASNLVLLIAGCLIFFYATEFLLKDHRDVFKVKNKGFALVIFITFIGSILFAAYYVSFR
ncbi:hypothetical protein QWY16_11305 [Planococcus shenhongbingii]|uniref:hypothetical protein n=1 Tax=Planococcus shenhongbingii TaxID=3058398 RepID=UPI002607439E|nr:hypothetical protein [Planococcus sp. N016]WKA57088.1 hypothetical protein QWY16_11305 [Planococcus sp. N016]